MYNILVLTNSLKFDIQTECEHARKYFSSRLPFEIKFNFQEVSIPVSLIPYKTIPGFDKTTGYPKLLSECGITTDVKEACKKLTPQGIYDAVIFIYDVDTITLPPNGITTSFSDAIPLYPNTQFIQVATNQYLKDTNELVVTIPHEMMHAFCSKIKQDGIDIHDEMDITLDGKPFFLNSTPESPIGNFARTLTNLSRYFNKIVSTKNTMHTYTYFKENEVTGLKPELVSILDKARGIANTPFVLTSGYRTPDENKKVGGVANSAHLTGEAVDIACTDNHLRMLIINSLLQVGFVRIEMCPNHIHCDISKTLPQNVFVLSQNG